VFVDHGGAVRVRRETDFCVAWNALTYRRARRLSRLYAFHIPSPFSRADVFHLYNSCSISRRPWVVTVENWPFADLGPLDRSRLVAADPCRRVLGISEWVREQYERNVGGTPIGDEILAKMIVLPPPQALIPRSAETPNTDRIRMCFVGSSFFRKGGLELLRAFDAAYVRYPQLHLEIVSALATDAYPPETSFTAADVAEAKTIIERHPDGIRWHRFLPNVACLELMSRSHIGLLPTYFDTYGFSALEMMAAGCGMVATNQRALAEVVRRDRGWIVEMPLDESRTIDRSNERSRALASRTLVEQLVAIFEEIAEDPAEAHARGRAARDYIARNHDPLLYASQLRTVYEAALTH
jgi:glycosyltransferase involved in cell wall biosynthesis